MGMTTGRCPRNEILVGDCVSTLASLPDGFAQTCITSPPYWGLRDYGIHHEGGAIGLEPSLDDHLDALVRVFRGVRRALRRDGTLWLNYGDAYVASAGPRPPNHPHGYGKRENSRPSKATRVPNLKPKDLMGLPWRVAFALQDDGWWLRSDIVWHKPNPMPDSVTDRPTRAHEYVFLLAASADYFYDAEAIKEKASDNTHSRGKGTTPKGMLWPAIGEKHRNAGMDVPSGVPMKAKGRPRQNESFQAAISGAIVPYRNKRSVWTVPTQPTSEAHFATFPEALVEPCILAGTSSHGACPTCGAPWARQVESDMSDVVRSRTVGWAQSCRCQGGEEPVPCIVLDPFFGSGTTGLVAKRLGRDFVGCELNHEYAAMSLRRLSPVMNRRLDQPWSPP